MSTNNINRFLNQAERESRTDAFIARLVEAGNVFGEGEASWAGSCLDLHLLLLNEANGLTIRQRETYCAAFGNPPELSYFLNSLVASALSGKGEIRRIDHPSSIKWAIKRPLADPAPELRKVLRIVFDTEEERARFEGWLSAQMTPERCAFAQRIKKIVTEERA